MIKMLISFCIGAGAMYLYIHPGDVDGMKQTGWMHSIQVQRL